LSYLVLRMHRHVDEGTVYVVLGVEARRADGSEVLWSVSLTTRPARMTVTGAVEVSRGDDWIEVFELADDAADPEEAAEVIHAHAAEVCRQVRWIRVEDEGS